MSKTGAGLLVVAALFWPAGASAALKLCNQTSYILYAATGLQQGADIEAKGWTRLIPGACQTVIEGALNRAASFVYAHTSHAHNGPARAWGGTIPLCARDNSFSLTLPAGDTRCEDRKAFALPFSRVDSTGHADWTMTFDQSPPLASPDAAREAGLARLLADAGQTKGGPAKALAAFKQRMKMPANAAAGELFDALETAALALAAPAGYSICNDTDAPLFAAIALKESGLWHTRGWWQVLPASCAQALSQPLATDAVYLLAERKDGKAIVSGAETFCITQIPFDVEGRGECKSRGLVSTGFARTATKGAQGHAAHISNDGLIPGPIRGSE